MTRILLLVNGEPPRATLSLRARSYIHVVAYFQTPGRGPARVYYGRVFGASRFGRALDSLPFRISPERARSKVSSYPACVCGSRVRIFVSRKFPLCNRPLSLFLSSLRLSRDRISAVAAVESPRKMSGIYPRREQTFFQTFPLSRQRQVSTRENRAHKCNLRWRSPGIGRATCAFLPRRTRVIRFLSFSRLRGDISCVPHKETAHTRSASP